MNKTNYLFIYTISLISILLIFYLAFEINSFSFISISQHSIFSIIAFVFSQKIIIKIRFNNHYGESN